MQPGEAVATDLEAFPVEFIPEGLRKAQDLLRPIDAEVPGVDPDDLLRQPLVLLRPCGLKIRIGLAAPVFVRAGGGDPQNSARLFPRRRGSARSRRSPRGTSMQEVASEAGGRAPPFARQANDFMCRQEARNTRSPRAGSHWPDLIGLISSACRSSRFSRPGAFMRAAISVGTPARLPASTLAFFTHSFSVCAAQPILAAIEVIAAHQEGCSCSRSRTSRIACSRKAGKLVRRLAHQGSSFSEAEPSGKSSAVQIDRIQGMHLHENRA